METRVINLEYLKKEQEYIPYHLVVANALALMEVLDRAYAEQKISSSTVRLVSQAINRDRYSVGFNVRLFDSLKTALLQETTSDLIRYLDEGQAIRESNENIMEPSINNVASGNSVTYPLIGYTYLPQHNSSYIKRCTSHFSVDSKGNVYNVALSLINSSTTMLWWNSHLEKYEEFFYPQENYMEREAFFIQGLFLKREYLALATLGFICTCLFDTKVPASYKKYVKLPREVYKICVNKPAIDFLDSRRYRDSLDNNNSDKFNFGFEYLRTKIKNIEEVEKKDYSDLFIKLDTANLKPENSSSSLSSLQTASDEYKKEMLEELFN